MIGSKYHKEITIRNVVKSQKLDIIAFCNTYNIYPKLKNYFQSQLDNYVLDNVKGEELFVISKLSNIDFLNPDKLNDSDDSDDEDNTNDTIKNSNGNLSVK